MLQRLAQAQSGQSRHMQFTLARLNDVTQRIGPQIAKFGSIWRTTAAQRIQNNYEGPSHVLRPFLA
jgi:hypothetical protein